MGAQLHLENLIGVRITVDVSDLHTPLDTMRHWGRKGWSCGPAPVGGYRLPLAQDGHFDWALIGAREFEMDGESAVFHRGHVYKRREYEQEEKGKKLPAAVKYSRGAKPTDDPAVVEKGSGDINYVTLITFKGNGHVVREFAPQAHNANAAEKPVPERAAHATGPKEPEIPAVEPGLVASNNVPTQVTHVGKPDGFSFPTDEMKAVVAILRLNGFDPQTMTATDHDDMRVLVAAVSDGVSPLTIVEDRVPKRWSGFSIDDLGKYWSNPDYLDSWWDHRPFRPLTKAEAFARQKALIEQAGKAATGEVKPPPPAQEEKAPPPPKAEPGDEKISRITANVIKSFARDANQGEDGLREMVWEISDRRTNVLKELTQKEGDDLIQMLRLIIRSNSVA